MSLPTSMLQMDLFVTFFTVCGVGFINPICLKLTILTVYIYLCDLSSIRKIMLMISICGLLLHELSKYLCVKWEFCSKRPIKAQWRYLVGYLGLI